MRQVDVRRGPGGRAGAEDLEESHHAGVESRSQPQVQPLGRHDQLVFVTLQQHISVSFSGSLTEEANGYSKTFVDSEPILI